MFSNASQDRVETLAPPGDVFQRIEELLSDKCRLPFGLEAFAGGVFLGINDETQEEAPLITEGEINDYEQKYISWIESGARHRNRQEVRDELINIYVGERGGSENIGTTDQIARLLEVLDDLTIEVGARAEVGERVGHDIKYYRKGKRDIEDPIGVRFIAAFRKETTKREREATCVAIELNYPDNKRAQALAGILKKRWEL